MHSNKIYGYATSLSYQSKSTSDIKGEQLNKLLVKHHGPKWACNLLARCSWCYKPLGAACRARGRSGP